MTTHAFPRLPVSTLVASGEAELKTGPFGTQLKASEYTEVGTPVINVRNIGMGSIKPDKLEFISESTRDRLSGHVLRPGDIVFGRKGAVERHVFIRAEQDGWFQGSDCLRLRLNSSRVEPLFASYFFLTEEHQRWMMNQCSHGATMASLNQAVLQRIELPVPPLEVQQRIAGVLSAYDELIENSQRRIQILEAMARALYREWFVEFRFPGHERVPLVASALGEIPKGWGVSPLGSVCERITDGSHKSPPSVNEGYPMASVKDMTDWGIDIDGCRRIGAEDYRELMRNHCKPLKNDVLVAKDGSYLKHTFVVGDEQDLVILSSIALLRPNAAVLPNYLSFTLREPGTKARMTGFVSGVAIPRIVLKDFRHFLVLVPPPDIQAKWARQVDPEVNLCRTLVSQVRHLRRTRDLLLPRLLSGQVTLADTAA